MTRKQQIINCLFFAVMVYSCSGQVISNRLCEEKLEAARQIASINTTRPSALDSAMAFLSASMECDQTRKIAVEFKIRLFVTMKKYSQGIRFIDSLSEENFAFPYKKQFLSKGLQALAFDNNHDTLNSHRQYQEISNDMEHYIEKRHPGDKEFNEVYTDLFVVKRKYLDNYQINKEVESLVSIYPEKRQFFGMLKDVE